jgi:demethylmenaquinone methyltransferase/2-methoxy-6-polyprenyl-1,4-benzoquinol methylase
MSPADPGSYAGPEGQAVRNMFGAIAHRYDLLNHLLSASVDRRWRRQAVARIAELGPRPGDRCLDLCTGTGDLAIEIAGRLGLETVSSDFCHPMLVESRRKVQRRPGLPIRTAEADAQQLPFADGSFRFVTVAFGIRNVESLERALEEMYRMLEPGGAALVLEFSKPVVPGFRRIFDVYFTHVLPRIGAWVSGVDGPYRYLPASVRRFPSQAGLALLLERAGFREVGYRNLTGGIAALHWGTRRSGDAGPRP